MSWKSQRDLRAAYRNVFDSDQGEKVLADLADHGCMMRSSYVPGDSHGTSFGEGARSVVLRVFGMIDKDESFMRELETRRKRTARQIGDGENE